MNISVNWLSALLGRQIDPADAAHRLAMLAAPVDAIEPIHRALEDIIVGLVERVEQHPNADRLTVCHVNTGREVVGVVCGAPNVTAGAKYPYAPEGATLPGGVRLSAKEIRGVLSHGMLCSARELGLGTDHAGILELATDAVPGTPLLEALPVSDTRLELDVTPNRPDLLCHRGVARELGAAYGAPVRLTALPGAPAGGRSPRRVRGRGAVGGVDVAIDDAEGCPRYIAAVIRGVTIGPSPAWLAARLRSVGARPINNVVDATNYILYELNQPMHAFDLAKLRGRAIIVRRARAGERLTTLDGEHRALTPEMTMICDAEGPTAIAGVMGGSDSEVTGATADVLLECAYFDPTRMRQTRRALKMSTEASYRFERGIDLEAMPEAVRRAVALIRAVAGGEEPEASIDVYPKPHKPRTVFLRPERVAHLLGTPVSGEVIERLLVSVGFAVAPKNGRFHVQIPGWRPDVTREVDLIEEVARLRGYDSFPVELRPFRPSAVPSDPVEPLKARIRRVLTSLGLHEARTLPLVREGSDTAQPVLNPLSAEESFLRERLLPGLVASVERNWATRERDIRLFEIGVVFGRARAGELPTETLRLAGVVTGARTPPHWSASGAADYDAWDLRSLFEEAGRVTLPAATLVAGAVGWRLQDAAGVGRGWAGEVAADRPAWAAPLFGFELDVGVGERPAATYRPLPTTPPIERDVALVVPGGVVAAEVEAVMRDAGGALLERWAIFDEYRSTELAGRSVAWRLVFRAADRTLRDEEADGTLRQILRALKEQLGVERREA